MSTGTPIVRTAQRDDVQAVVACLTAAFWDYPETAHLLPDEGKRRHVLPRYLKGDAADSLAYGTLLVARDPRDHSGVAGVAGVAAWLPPHAYPIAIRRQVAQVVHLAPALPWGLAAAREARRGQLAIRTHHQQAASHYYLRSLGVRPEWQGKGIGAALVAPILERADREGVGCYLTTATVDNVSWYERFGFTVSATFRPTPAWPQVWAMWRDPRDPRIVG